MKLKAEMMAEAECIEYHGCFTGDCPHDKAKDCAKHFFVTGYNARDQELKQDIKTTFYEGPGNHSVYSLETLVAEREEALYQKQLRIQDLEEKLDLLKACYDKSEAENAGLKGEL